MNQQDYSAWSEMQRDAAPSADEQLEMAYAQTYRFGEMPKWVVINEGGAAYIDTMHGRYWLNPGDVILYNAAWEPIDVVRVRALAARRGDHED